MFLLNEKKNTEGKKEYEWFFKKNLCPYDLKASSVFEVFASIASTKESLKAKGKNENQFEMKYRTRDDLNQRFHIDVNGGGPSITWNDKGFLFWKKSKIGIVRPWKKKKKSFIELDKLKQYHPDKKVHYKVTIKYESPGRYHIVIPIVKKKQAIENRTGAVSFDPGVRCFQTGFNSKNQFIEYGKKQVDRIYKKCLQVDKIHSLRDTYSGESKHEIKNERAKYKKKMGRVRHKIQDIKQDMHWKIVNDICKENEQILISRFPVSQMTKRFTRNINKETTKKMLNWSHFQFRQRLKHKSEEYHSHVHEVSEHYTSKSCGQCGRIHWKLGSNEVFKCPYCSFSIGRDFNGARNIMLMNLKNHLQIL
jgi:IS605 OrfB family transposase